VQYKIQHRSTCAPDAGDAGGGGGGDCARCDCTGSLVISARAILRGNGTVDSGFAIRKSKRRQEDAYLAEGIQDEILTRLAKVQDLKVISPASTRHYKSKPDNLPEIAKQLGAAHVLEGSVQKSAGTVAGERSPDQSRQ